jgi:FkbM family methyltransferase
MSMRKFQTPYGEMSVPSVEEKIVRAYETQGGYMKSDLTIMLSCVTKDSCVVDIGAHFGECSVPLSTVALEVHAFEPVPESRAILEKNVSANNRDNIKIYPFGLGSHRVNASIIRSKDSGSNRLEEGEGSVEVVTLDSQHLSPAFIKIDVEGMEGEVIAGGQRTIAAHHPAIFFEVNTKVLKTSLRQIAEMLKGYVFFYNLHPDQDGRVNLGKLPFLSLLRYGSGTQNVLAVFEGKISFPHTSPLETLFALVFRKSRNFLKRKRIC